MCNELRGAGREQAIDIYLASPILGKVTATACAANYCGPVTIPSPSTSPIRDGPPNRGLCHLLFMNRTRVSLKSHGIYYMCKGCEMGPTVYLPYPSRLKILTVCRCRKKGSTFSSVILIPLVLVQLPTRSADQRLSKLS